ncbi:hypothetical protein Acsp06_55090 [Actinomycetospora sp. NBRC 106375]|uniref:LutC/YkgG family protein n=1 Tax=Actinomycetospora sp. NBRC 106375 TaxID=3032207 RepID=UPI0024A1686A|nr:LUD domain-containing protein [Actinomycetospora sp. NBRC 106375]GLZ49324.1 hypothetical protein Acsp06_55090 [Actinomycetospora sp. NBRC 106375]
MTARDVVLARVRRALRDVPPEETPADVEVVRSGPSTAPLTPGHVELFAERVAQYRARVVRCVPDDLVATLVPLLEDVSTLLVPFDLPRGLRPAGPRHIEDRQLPTGELDAVDGVLTTARLGIVETGTIVLDHGPGQGRRAATLVPDIHVCVLWADQLVAGVPEAIVNLDPTRPHTWISGPSATSDIELERVEGVHGPRTLRVVLVG